MEMIVLASAAVLSFCAVDILLGILLRKKLQVQERLNGINKETAVKDEKKDKQLFRFIHVSKRLKEQVSLSGVRMRPEEFLVLWFLVIFAPPMLLFAFSPNLIQCMGLLLIGLAVPPCCLQIATSRQRALFETQLGDALMVLSNGLRAGFSFEQALENVSEDLEAPIGSEFNMVVRELKLGEDVEHAFLKVAERMKSDDLKLLTTAVVVQQKVGGNLSEILDTISQTIRDRLSIKRSVKTLTAQGRISGKVVGALPVLLLLAISFLNPGYVSPLFSSMMGRLMLVVGLGMELLGFLVISRIVDIKF